MSVVLTESVNYGPFKVIEELADRLRCDGTDYPFIVIGPYTISEDDGLAPPPPIPQLSIEEVRNAAQNIILAAYPIWYQTNCANGVYPADIADVMRDDIALVIAESNRCEDEITAGGTPVPNWPTIGV